MSPKTRLDATDGAVNVPIGRRANRTVIAVLVHSEQRVIQLTRAPFQLAHRPKLRNRLTCPNDDNSLAAPYSGNEAREASLRIVDIDGFAAHMRSMAIRAGLINLARGWSHLLSVESPRAEPSIPDVQEKRLRLASRIGTVLMLAMVRAWVGVLASVSSSLESINGVLTIAYMAALLAPLGALAVLAEALRRVLRGPGGWLVRSGEALLGLCAIYGIWAILFFGFADFSYRW